MEPVPIASPQTTRAIILGAQKWPQFPDLRASELFFHSATDFCAYLEDPRGLGLPPGSVLNLFDNGGSPDEIDKAIADFLTAKAAGPITDVLVYYVGHGESSSGNKELYLAIQRTRHDNVAVSSIPVSALRNTLERNAGQTRRLIILDCCFAAAAFAPFQELFGPPPLGLTENKVPGKAVSLLCSSSAADPSFYTGNRYTMFTEALLQVVRSGSVSRNTVLTPRELKDQLNSLLALRYQTRAPRAEVYPADSREGDLADVPYFRIFRPSGRKLPENPPSPDLTLSDSVSCFLLISETEELANGGSKLAEYVNTALKTNRQEIEEVAGRQLLKDRAFRGFASTSVSTVAEFESAVRWLCRADIAVFDLTGYEPGVMLLLGIRAVARRGITICTVHSRPDEETTETNPFNLQDINVLYYWDEQVGTDRDPMDMIAYRCVQAYREMRQQPRYLDLPAFDAVRMVSPDPDGGRTLTYRERVLVLCPFDPVYQSLNWRKHLHRDLPNEIKGRLGLKKKPEMIRTLDLNSPRIVSQSLFECIRLTELCLVDWTAWRPNVFFEMGVRLACSPIGPVLLIEKSGLPARPVDKKMDKPEDAQDDGLSADALEQRFGLLSLFRPIPYQCEDGPATHTQEGEKSVYAAILDLHEALRDDKATRATPEELGPNATFKLISEWIDYRTDLSARPIQTELSAAADLLASPDPEAAGRSQVLYPRNQRLSIQSQEAARERRLAAWYYVDQRFTQDQIASQPELLALYRQLGALACNALITSERSSDREAAKEIKNRIAKLN